jgi:hypothetical protein
MGNFFPVDRLKLSLFFANNLKLWFFFRHAVCGSIEITHGSDKGQDDH